MNHREASQGHWKANDGVNGGPTIEEINSGSLQRIADAAELMAKNHAHLIEERDSYQRWYRESQVCVKKRDGTIAALRAWATRRKIAAARKP